MDTKETSQGAEGRSIGAVFDRRSILAGGLLAAGAGFSSLSSPRAFASPIPKTQFTKLVPEEIGGWRASRSAELVIKAEDDVQDKLYENLETRIYEGPNLPAIMLLIAYSSVQQNDVQVHRPEICYPAAGLPIEQTRPSTIEFGSRTVDALELIADRGGAKEKILYWIRVGESFPRGWVDLRLTTAIANTKGVTPDGLLFRVSTIDNSSGFSSQTLANFSRAFVAASPPSLRKVLLF